MPQTRKVRDRVRRDARQINLKNLSSIYTKRMEGHILMLWKMKQELGQQAMQGACEYGAVSPCPTR